MSSSCVWPIYKTVRCYQNGSGSNDNNGILCISQSSNSGASPTDGLMSYQGYLVAWRAYLSKEMQLVYSIAPADRLWLGYLQVGELHHWYLCHLCIALNLAVQFKLLSGICVLTHDCVHVQLDSLLYKVGQWPAKISRARASALAPHPLT